MRRLLVLLALLVAVALGLEVALRVSGPGDAALSAVLTDGGLGVRGGLLELDEERFYRLAPGYRAADEHAGTYALDRWPWRGRPATPAPDDVLRVVVLGDSCVFGIGLDTADTLPEQLARALADRGLGPHRVQVLNLGVPGYSTLQVERVLRWALDELRPAVAVVYTAAWNDQAPALARADAELFRGREGLYAISRLARTLRAKLTAPRHSPAEVVELWETGAPPYGRRLARDEVEPALRRLVALSRARAAEPILLVPAHPASTTERYPALLADREAVRAAAASEGAASLDVALARERSPLPDEALFVDFVHPAPTLWQAVVGELADRVVAGLASRGHATDERPASIPTWNGAIAPAEVSSFGDASITLDLTGWEGWQAGDPMPAVLVGGAPLHGVRVVAGVLTGTVIQNAPGDWDVVVQSRRDVAVLADGIRLVAPRFERSADGAVTLRGRPGDTATVVVGAARLDHPRYTPSGPEWIQKSAVRGRPQRFELDARGEARLQPYDAERFGKLHAQALVEPKGTRPGGPEARYTAVLEL